VFAPPVAFAVSAAGLFVDTGSSKVYPILGLLISAPFLFWVVRACT